MNYKPVVIDAEYLADYQIKRPVQLNHRLKGLPVSALRQAALLTNRRGMVCFRTQIA